VSIADGKAIQQRLPGQIFSNHKLVPKVQHGGGLDISGNDNLGRSLGIAVILKYPALLTYEVQATRSKPGMPHVPGLRSFREIPVLAEALEVLTATPDLVIVGGHGYAHPRRFGLDCLLGLLMNLPTIGCAKSIPRNQLV
jgi:deoxyribonuclease V